MKKLVIILLTLLMLLSSFAVLGEELALTSDPMTITLWDIATDEPQRSIQEGAVARFMAAYPNITVNQVHIQNDNYKQQLIVAMSSGQAPDMYIHWAGGPMAEYYKSGFVNDITEMFAKYDHVECVVLITRNI